MITDIWLFSLFLLITGALIFILVFFIITLSDLECDYLNAQECCGRLNFWNIPKLWLQLVIPILLLLSGHWLLVLLNIPVSVWLVRKFHFVPRGNLGEYDPAEIHNAGMIKRHMLQVCCHLAWQMVSFFLYLYCLLDSVMSEDVILPLDDDVTVLGKPADTKYYTYPPPHDHHPADSHRDYDF